MKKADQKTTERLWRKARIASWFLACTPYVRMVGLNGSVARGVAHASSDIDFIIIAKSGRIWSARALSMITMAIFGWKRYEHKIAGRVCLNLYQTVDHLELTTKTEKLAQAHAATFPFWSSRIIFKKFTSANQWIKKFGQYFQYRNYEPNIFEKIVTFLVAAIRFLGEFIFDLIFNDWGERVLKNYQTQRIMKDRRTASAPPGAIYLSDFELRFHPPKI